MYQPLVSHPSGVTHPLFLQGVAVGPLVLPGRKPHAGGLGIVVFNPETTAEVLTVHGVGYSSVWQV